MWVHIGDDIKEATTQIIIDRVKHFPRPVLTLENTTSDCIQNARHDLQTSFITLDRSPGNWLILISKIVFTGSKYPKHGTCSIPTFDFVFIAIGKNSRMEHWFLDGHVEWSEFHMLYRTTCTEHYSASSTHHRQCFCFQNNIKSCKNILIQKSDF